MNAPLRRLLSLGTTPLTLIVTLVVLVGFAVASPFLDPGVAASIFQPLALAVLLEIVITLGGMARTLDEVNGRVEEQDDDFSLVAPPHVTSPALLDRLEELGHGSLKIIAYGTNRFGRVLEAVEERFPLVKTDVLVCGSNAALGDADRQEIDEIAGELSQKPHIAVWRSTVLPTVRAAVLRNSDGTPVWASMSFYLVDSERKRRGLKSEGISPVMMSSSPGSRPMRVIVDFVDAEFDRLQRDSAAK